MELIPEKIVDGDSEKGNFVVDGAKLDTELENIVVFVLEIGDKVGIFSWIDAEDSRFSVDVSRLDDHSGNVFVPVLITDSELEFIPENIVDGESVEGNFVVNGAKLDTKLENSVVSVLKIGDEVEMFSWIDAEESNFAVDESGIDDKIRECFCTCGRRGINC